MDEITSPAAINYCERDWRAEEGGGKQGDRAGDQGREVEEEVGGMMERRLEREEEVHKVGE